MPPRGPVPDEGRGGGDHPHRDEGVGKALIGAQLLQQPEVPGHRHAPSQQGFDRTRSFGLAEVTIRWRRGPNEPQPGR